MSRPNSKVKDVASACLRLASIGQNPFTVGMVARAANVSHNTARKHVQRMAELNDIHHEEVYVERGFITYIDWFWFESDHEMETFAQLWGVERQVLLRFPF